MATVGKYNDRDGNEKRRYLNVGAVFENDQGQLSLKIEAVPVGQDWNGWVSFYAPKDAKGDKPANSRSASSDDYRKASGGGAGQGGTFNDFDDDTPFRQVGRGVAGHCFWG